MPSWARTGEPHPLKGIYIDTKIYCPNCRYRFTTSTTVEFDENKGKYIINIKDSATRKSILKNLDGKKAEIECPKCGFYNYYEDERILFLSLWHKKNIIKKELTPEEEAQYKELLQTPEIIRLHEKCKRDNYNSPI